MIKAMAKGAQGRELLVLGLSYANLKQFLEHPLNTFIRVDGKDHGLPLDIMIFSGATEQDMLDMMIEQKLVNETTTIVRSPKMV